MNAADLKMLNDGALRLKTRFHMASLEALQTLGVAVIEEGIGAAEWLSTCKAIARNPEAGDEPPDVSGFLGWVRRSKPGASGIGTLPQGCTSCRRRDPKAPGGYVYGYVLVLRVQFNFVTAEGIDDCQVFNLPADVDYEAPTDNLFPGLRGTPYGSPPWFLGPAECLCSCAAGQTIRSRQEARYENEKADPRPKPLPFYTHLTHCDAPVDCLGVLGAGQMRLRERLNREWPMGQPRPLRRAPNRNKATEAREKREPRQVMEGRG